MINDAFSAMAPIVAVNQLPINILVVGNGVLASLSRHLPETTSPALLGCFQGWRQEFSDGVLILPTRGLNTVFRVSVMPKNLRKSSFQLLTGG